MKVSLRFCSIEWTERGALTTFPDGGSTEAFPHPEQPHYHVIAHRCGYGDNLLAYCREHELAHIVVAEELCGGASPVLLAQSSGFDLAPGEDVLEELAAQALQRFVRANERPIVGGVEWDRLRSLFVAYADALWSKLP